MSDLALKSRFIDNNRELVVHTEHDLTRGIIVSNIFVEGLLVEQIELPRPEQFGADETRMLMEHTHAQRKTELEALIDTCQRVSKQGDPDQMYKLANGLYCKGFLPQAEELLRAVVQMSSSPHQAENVLGMVLTALGKYDEAIEVAFSAISQCPTYADYQNNLGNTYLLKGSCGEAISRFDQATKINIYYGDAYYNYGLALILNAVKQQAKEFFDSVISRSTDALRKAVMTVPEYGTSRFEDGIRSLTDTDLDNAYDLLKKNRDQILDWRRRTQAVIHMSFVLHPDWVNEGIVRDRIKVLKEQLSRNPGYADIYPELSRCYLEAARLSCGEAIKNYQKAVEINPTLTTLSDSLIQTEQAYQQLSETIDQISRKR